VRCALLQTLLQQELRIHEGVACKFATQDPSLTSRKANESLSAVRPVFTQPPATIAFKFISSARQKHRIDGLSVINHTNGRFKIITNLANKPLSMIIAENVLDVCTFVNAFRVRAHLRTSE
jgi:hypothetical protein